MADVAFDAAAVPAGADLARFLCLVGDDLVAQVEALVADDGVPGGSVGLCGGDAGLGGDLVALLTAEVALGAGLLVRHGVERAARGGDGDAVRDHVPGQRDAAAADPHARAGDQLSHVVLGFTAERAGQ